MNKDITVTIFCRMNKCGILNHFVEENSGREIVVENLKRILIKKLL